VQVRLENISDVAISDCKFGPRPEDQVCNLKPSVDLCALCGDRFPF
jgi:hypothetical protein